MARSISTRFGVYFIASMAIGTVLCVPFMAAAVAAQGAHDHGKGMDMPMKHSEKMSSRAALKPAQGASIKIVSPKHGQTIKGDAVALEFEFKKGKVGEHVHAYVDGELAGMFKGTRGTLNGLAPGAHTIELRVATGDHKTELDATDRVTFKTE